MRGWGESQYRFHEFTLGKSTPVFIFLWLYAQTRVRSAVCPCNGIKEGSLRCASYATKNLLGYYSTPVVLTQRYFLIETYSLSEYLKHFVFRIQDLEDLFDTSDTIGVLFTQVLFSIRFYHPTLNISEALTLGSGHCETTPLVSGSYSTPHVHLLKLILSRISYRSRDISPKDTLR